MIVAPADARPAVSVVVCTRDRAASLARTLESLTRIAVPDGLAWEVIVVDNGSTDATPSVIRAFGARLPLRGVVEDEAGLSRARNCGVASARGRHLIWTDDDVEVDPGWLTAYAEAFARYPDAALFGGCSIPVLEEPAAPWVRSNVHALRDLLAIRTFGPEPIALSLARGLVPFGLNYAVRADVQRRFAYDPDLGVAPGRRIGGEELHFYERVLEGGYLGIGLPGPLVRHHIPLARQNLAYIRSYYSSAGETQAILRFRAAAPTASELALILLKSAAARAVALVAAPLPPSARLPHLIRAAYHAGFVRRLGGARTPASRARALGQNRKETMLGGKFEWARPSRHPGTMEG